MFLRFLTGGLGLATACLALGLGCATVLPAQTIGTAEWDHAFDSRRTFSREMPKTVRADHPAIVPVAEAIRAVTRDKREQLIMVHDVSHLLVDYDADERVYGEVEYHATLDEMIARRRQAGWVYLRDDCDGRAVFAAHLLAALDIPWRLEASYWKRHAWISAKVDGEVYDLLDLGSDAPELQAFSYKTLGRLLTRKTRVPPFFHWRKAWLSRTRGDVEIGRVLGLLEVHSQPGKLRERFAVDWVKKSPGGRTSPTDPRMQLAPYAGFPLREPLNPSNIYASQHPEAGPTHSGPALSQPSETAER